MEFRDFETEFPWGHCAFVLDVGAWPRRRIRRLVGDLDRSGGCVQSACLEVGVQPVTDRFRRWCLRAVEDYWAWTAERLDAGLVGDCFNYEPERFYPGVLGRVERLEAAEGRRRSVIPERDCARRVIRHAAVATLEADAARRAAAAAGRRSRCRFSPRLRLEIVRLLDDEDLDLRSAPRLCRSLAERGGTVEDAYWRLGVRRRPGVADGLFSDCFAAVGRSPEAPPLSLAHEVYRAVGADAGRMAMAEPARWYRLIRNRLAVIAAVRAVAPRSAWSSAAVAGLVEAYVTQSEETP